MSKKYLPDLNNSYKIQHMSLEIRLDDRLAQVELIEKDGNLVEIEVDGRQYKVDILLVEEGVYSILHKGVSYTIELIPGESRRLYKVNSLKGASDIEIIDAETRYMQSRKGDDLEDDENTISSPMPGKIVKIMVKVGEEVEQGKTVIIVSAMKMESEYKTGKAGKIKEILVREGDTIEGNKPLITIE